MILAGVTISSITNENGVIRKATKASEEAHEADEITAIELSMQKYKIAKYTDPVDLVDMLKGEDWCSDAVYNEDGETATVTVKEYGHQYNVKGNGEIAKLQKVEENFGSGQGPETDESEDEPVVLAAGLYDENDNLLVSWDELVNTYGLDVSKDYTSSTYKTDAQSGYSVFTNNNLSGKLVIGEEVTNIGEYAFSYCTGLTSVIIPESVRHIFDEAFYNCNNLTSIEIPDGITTIHYESFLGCSSLTSITYLRV